MKKQILLMFSLLFFTGCGTGTLQLGGTVTYEDGTPLTAGNVIFSTDTFMARGNIDSNGKYTMGSYGEKDGLPKGSYKVYINGAEEEYSKKGELFSWSLIDPKYAAYASTPLTCEIPAPNNTFDIKVPKNPSPKPK